MREPYTTERSGMFWTERGLAWIFGIAALAFGAMGLLVGFGIVGPQGVDIEGFEGVGDIAGLQSAAVQGSFWDAMVWMLPGIASAILAMSMGRAEHHWGGTARAMAHSGAYLMMLLTIAVGALAFLVGFNVLDQGYTQTDGVIWGMTAVASGLITGALHAAVPAMVADEDYLMRLVESRVSQAHTAGGTTRVTEPEV